MDISGARVDAEIGGAVNADRARRE
ncbi:hypothetical protein M2323_003850 [Rhodoblastus acidophilus]|nr:hypothetical protein [Rhodoblastus acidophilus]MCW2334907.1 hypothetical protein [Rhodoblastus acidophilus]